MKDYTFCPFCGEQHALVQRDASRYSCTACQRDVWDNPKAAVAIVILNDDQQLLVAKRARDPQKGKFDLPGGFIEYNEDPYRAAVREIREETGLRLIGRPEILEAYTHDYGHDESVCDLIMLADDWEGTLRAQDDVDSLHWESLEFIDSSRFAWPYTRLAHLLKAHVAVREKVASGFSK